MFDWLKNGTINANRYKTDSDAAVIACYFNPQKSPYRFRAFKEFYKTVKHLDTWIIECVIGDDEPELDIYEDPRIITVRTENLFWHKEGLLNKLIHELPERYKYIFWLDCDVIFENHNWLIDGVRALKQYNIIQPFEYCVHLAKDELRPSFDTYFASYELLPHRINPKVWKSFCSNYILTDLWKNEIYDNHGHVGFAWGARRDILKKVPLYDKALVGGADHIIAHAAAGQINHSCIAKAFPDEMKEINEWSKKFYDEVHGSIGYVSGGLYHIWHGDIEKRQYLKRVQEFAPHSKEIKEKDANGLYVGNDTYVRKYFRDREVPGNFYDDYDESDFIGDVITGSLLIGDVLFDNTDPVITDPGIIYVGGDTTDAVPEIVDQCDDNCDCNETENVCPEPVYDNTGNLDTDSSGTFS